ncbi:hypothetical protein ACJX0J_007007 [Zea mays]
MKVFIFPCGHGVATSKFEKQMNDLAQKVARRVILRIFKGTCLSQADDGLSLKHFTKQSKNNKKPLNIWSPIQIIGKPTPDIIYKHIGDCHVFVPLRYSIIDSLDNFIYSLLYL